MGTAVPLDAPCRLMPLNEITTQECTEWDLRGKLMCHRGRELRLASASY